MLIISIQLTQSKHTTNLPPSLSHTNECHIDTTCLYTINTKMPIYVCLLWISLFVYINIDWNGKCKNAYIGILMVNLIIPHNITSF